MLSKQVYSKSRKRHSSARRILIREASYVSTLSSSKYLILQVAHLRSLITKLSALFHFFPYLSFLKLESLPCLVFGKKSFSAFRPSQRSEGFSCSLVCHLHSAFVNKANLHHACPTAALINGSVSLPVYFCCPTRHVQPPLFC